jgi:hypothetical protein
MTSLLTKAIERASSLPAALQDELAAVMIEEIDSELRWEQQFANSADALAKLGHKALEEYQSGHTQKLGFDEL